MDLTHVGEKLTEARRSLDRMIDQEQRLISEEFTDHLTAFLAAGMAVRDPFKSVKTWCESWQKSLTTDEKRIWDAMLEARHDEAHIARKWRSAQSARSRKRAKAGFKLWVGHEEIKIGVGSSYSDKSGRVEGWGSPPILLTRGTNTTAQVATAAVVVKKKIHFYIGDGKKRKVTEVCTEYLALLQRMVTDFEADNP